MINSPGLMNGIAGFFALLYPVGVYFGIQYFQPWVLAIFLFCLISLQLLTAASNKKPNYFLLLLGIVYCFLAIWNNNLMTLRFYPALVSFTLLFAFMGSLFYPPPVIERLARLQHPDLPEQGVIYTRKVTQVWCVFFLINGSVATMTAIYSSIAFWSLYNGFIAYLLMVLVMGIEYLIRVKTQDHVR